MIQTVFSFEPEPLPEPGGREGTQRRSSWRELARSVIAPIIDKTRGQSRKLIRKALREARPEEVIRGGRAAKIWREEVAIAMRVRSRRSYKRTRAMASDAIMRSMRNWAARKGALEIQATFDVDDFTDEDARPPFKLTN